MVAAPQPILSTSCKPFGSKPRSLYAHTSTAIAQHRPVRSTFLFRSQLGCKPPEWFRYSGAGTPADKQRVAEYEAGPHKGYGKEIQEAFAAIVPPHADAGVVADAIVKVVDAPFGKRPFRVHVEPTQDGADVAFAVMDRVRTEMLHRVGLSELLTPAGAESRIVSNA